MTRFLPATLCATLVASVSGLLPSDSAHAQRGDRQGHVMTENWRDMTVPPAPVLSPEEGLASLRVAPGYAVELVAAEPLIEDPVAIAWDPQERLWAVEMRGFMPNVDGIGETEPVGRVVVLEDLDGDRVMDRSTVFLDGLVSPRALAIVAGGVLVAEPPNLWLAIDDDGDLRADRKERIAEYADADPDLLEHTENGLLWALDNWIYSAKSDRRLRYRDGKIEVQTTAFRGQWGIAQDDVGRLFYNTNSRYLIGDLFPPEYVLRSETYRPSGQGLGVSERLVQDESVYPIRVNPGVNRGYMKGVLRDDGRLARTTSVSGLCINRGDAFPAETRGDFFIPEPAGNTIAHFRPRSAGVELELEHLRSPDADYDERDFLASTDERFRPVDCAFGPDGALYVVDMYRGILQHQRFVTTYLRKQILERELDRPIGLGRIYRIAPEGPSTSPSPAPALATTAQRVAALASPNGFWRDTAQRLLVESQDPTAVATLEQIVSDSSASTPARLHALWTLEGLGAVHPDVVDAAVEHTDEWIAVHGLRVAEAYLTSADSSSTTDWAEALAKKLEGIVLSTAKVSPALRLQAHHTLGTLVLLEPPSPRALSALERALVSTLDDPYHRQATLTGFAGRESELVSAALRGLRTAEGAGGKLLTDLAEVALYAVESQPAALERLAASLRGKAKDEAVRGQLLEELVTAAKGTTFRLPYELSPAHFASSDWKIGRGQHRGRVQQLASALDGAHSRHLDYQGELARRAAAQEALSAALLTGERLYSACTSCHGDDGAGIQEIAPGLLGTEWVTGSAQRLAALVLHGIEGEIEVDGVLWNDVMPGFANDQRFNDAAVAALLTYLRVSFGGMTEAVGADEVRAFRELHGDRTSPWTPAELQALAEP